MKFERKLWNCYVVVPLVKSKKSGIHEYSVNWEYNKKRKFVIFSRHIKYNYNKIKILKWERINISGMDKQ